MINNVAFGASSNISNFSKVQNEVEPASALKTKSAERDVFVRSANTEMFSEIKRTAKSLTQDDAHSLAQKYDVTNMTRNEFNQLLSELRNMGIINSQDFSVGYGGEIPHDLKEGEVRMTYGAPDESIRWPMGNERVDFIKLLRSCANYCSDFAADQEEDSDGRKVGNSLADSYHRLIDVLEQIKKAEKENKSASTSKVD